MKILVEEKLKFERNFDEVLMKIMNFDTILNFLVFVPKKFFNLVLLQWDLAALEHLLSAGGIFMSQLHVFKVFFLRSC